MQTEIEAKFLDIDIDEVRAKLKGLGAELEEPMRLMKRKMFDYPDNRFQRGGQSERLRIRDEGNKVMLNFKAKEHSKYTSEIEVEVESFDKMCQLFEAVGFISYSYQESKRETWSYKGAEVVIDEWPWLNPYIEIEGLSESLIQGIAKELGFDWKDAKYGSVDTAYLYQYQGMKKGESIGNLKEVRFDVATPEYFIKRRYST